MTFWLKPGGPDVTTKGTSTADAIEASRFGASRRASYRLVLPLSTLKPGEYLLSFEAKAGKLAARRELHAVNLHRRTPIDLAI